MHDRLADAYGDPATTDWSIASSVRHWVGRKPDAACIVADGRSLSWRALHERASRFAQGVGSLGAAPGHRVMYLGRNRPEFFEILVGSSMAGAVTTAVNWRLSGRETAYILDNSRAGILVVEQEFLPRIEEVRPRLTSIRTVVVLRDGGPVARRAATDDPGYESLLAAHPAVDPLVEVGPEDIGMQMYTSGTSGLPKGAMFSNRALQASGPMQEQTHVDENSVVLVAMPVFHASGSSLGMLSMRLGALMVIAREVVPTDLLRLIDEHRVTMTTVVPAVLKMMLESPAIASSDLSSLDTVAYAASPISPDLLRSALETFGCRFLQIYGLTETNGVTVLAPEDHLDPEHPERMSSAGRALPGAEVRVVDVATGESLPDGEFGEVWVRAQTSMSGYFGAESENAATLGNDGWIGTGDGGHLRDGYVYLRDRIKDMIITGGENVYPVEVENVLIGHPSVNDVAVIGVPSDKWGETVKAVVVRQGDAALDAQTVIAFAKAGLAGYKVPTSVEFVDELPRNPSGKVLKRVLRERFPG